MASIHCGQAALIPLPQKASKLQYLTDTIIAKSLTVEQSAVKDEGMLVYKVGKNGKLQPRRLAFSKDHRTLWVTSNKVTSLRAGLKKLVRAGDGGASANAKNQPSHLQTIDISRMDHVVQGQVARRFALASADENLDISGLNIPGGIEEADKLSLTLFYRECSKDSVLGKRNSHPRSKRQNILESLDLIVPDAQHYKELLSAFHDIMGIYAKQKQGADRTTLLFEYLWVDMGKSLSDDLTSGEWLDICERMNVPLSRGQCSALYKEASKHVRKERFPRRQREGFGVGGGGGGGGLPLWAVVELWNDVSYNTTSQDTESKAAVIDPKIRLWKELLKSDPVPALKPTSSANDEEAAKYTPGISGVAFLSFIRSQQKQFQTTLEDAVAIMHVLNGQKSKTPEGKEDRLTKSRFLQYLLSDSNDLMDPARGKVGSDDMNHPLSHYWICSSHDTYLNHWTPNKGPIHDEQMYLAALYRGVRCLELDVWDRREEPVICKDEPKSPEDPFLRVPIVLKLVRTFLLANPKCYPVILNIENHCNFQNKERLADYIFQILGKSGLIVVPDDTASIDEADLLPSPHSMRGKVLLMGKRPKVIEDGAKVINDDFDDENDRYEADELPSAVSREMEEAELDQGIVIGFDSAGPIKASKRQEKNIVQHSSGELLFMAKQDLEQAKMDAAQSELKALSLAEEADQAEKYADELILKAGLTKESVLELASQVKGTVIDPKEHVALLSARAEGEGVEVQEFFADGVEAARANFTDADQVAIEAASDATEALQRLNQATTKLREAEQLLEKSYTKERELVADYQRAAAAARATREDADYAKQRLEKVRQLEAECEASATSAENVVVTAMTEASISEKRAVETEARAARASKKAQEDRKRAEDETRKEETLEREAAVLHEQLADATERAKEARTTMEKAAAMIDRVNEQIKLIERSSQYAREKKEQLNAAAEEKKEATPGKIGKILAKHASRIEERRRLSESVQKATADFNEYDQLRKKLQDTFEKKAHAWKSQTETASKARKVADRSAHLAEELAEHAEEEREAANLRLAAQIKAKSNVSERDAYRNSLRAQLKEAERAAKEAERRAQLARSSADALEHVNNDLPTHDKNIRLLERRKAARDDAWEEYEVKKKIKEEAETAAAEAKRLFDTSETVFSQAMRNAAKEGRKADTQRQADRAAIVAFNQAQLARKQAEHALEDVQFAQGIVTERQVILKRATEYNEKMARIVAIPTSLAKMTFLHTTKHRHWDKSFNLPNTHVHSFSHGVLVEMKNKDNKNPENLVEFTTEHICRTFPSWKDVKTREKINSDPMFLWALGCQLVSLNYATFDEHVLQVDGRFRRNGSSGYVLKPENLTRDDPLRERQETWTIGILCGNCLPSPDPSKRVTINPFVKLSVYGGDVEGKSTEHRTNVVNGNGTNPIWDEKAGLTFTSRNPSLSLCVFTVWHKGEHGEEFIGGASIPVSCMREGVRSVALFDNCNSRTGLHAFASLLVRATKSKS